MKVETTAYVDGSLTVADSDQKRLEVIWLHRAQGHLALANLTTAALELSEVSMLYEFPIAIMKQQFREPCNLQAKIRYPVHAGSSDDLVSGQFELDGESIRFTLEERRGRSQFSYSGSVAYRSSRGMIPANLAIAGWTVFDDSVSPEDGSPSTFATFGDFRNSSASALK